jgi:MOSC domain-containing protein YiiM
MQVLAVSVGRARPVDWEGRSVFTGIFKAPVEGGVAVHAMGMSGDEQADPAVHGGADKAVYAYPGEHYPFWRAALALSDLPWGSFGENLTCAGLLEEDVGIGDRYRIGSTELAVTQPRLPCFKLGIRFGREDIIKRFLVSGRSGFYLSVARPGEIRAADRIEIVARHEDRLSVAEVLALRAGNTSDPSRLRLAAAHTGLSAGWREHFQEILGRQPRGEG